MREIGGSEQASTCILETFKMNCILELSCMQPVCLGNQSFGSQIETMAKKKYHRTHKLRLMKGL